MNPKPTAEQLKGGHGTLDTVKVEADNEDGYAVINESDFDPAVHKKFVSDDSKAPADMTKAELVEHLKALGIEVPAKAMKEQLLALVPAK